MQDSRAEHWEKIIKFRRKAKMTDKILGITRKCQDKTDNSFKNIWSVNK